MTHTLGPWESMKEHMPFKVGETMEFQVAEEGADPFDGIEILDTKKDEALIVPRDMIDYSDEMASFAVLALNSYLDLLGACVAVLDELKKGTTSGRGGFSRYENEHCQSILQSEIAKAKGQSPKKES